MYEFLISIKAASEQPKANIFAKTEDCELHNYETAKFPEEFQEHPLSTASYGIEHSNISTAKKSTTREITDKSSEFKNPIIAMKINTRNTNDTTPSKNKINHSTVQCQSNKSTNEKYHTSQKVESVYQRRNKSFSKNENINAEKPVTRKCVDDKLKSKLLEWMIHISLIKINSVTNENFPMYCRSGVLLSDLITCLEGVY